MKPLFHTSGQGFAAGAACLGLVLCLAAPLPAEARTTLQLETGDTLSFEDGSIDMRTGSGELYDVMLLEGDEPVLLADYLFIDASGEIGSLDWFIHELVAENAEVPEESVFIGRLELRDTAVGQLADDGRWQVTSNILPMTPASCWKMSAWWPRCAVLHRRDRLSALQPGTEFRAADRHQRRIDGRHDRHAAPESVPANPVLDKLAERGISDIGMDLRMYRGQP